MKSGRAAYHLASVTSTLMNFRHVLMNVGNDGVRVQNELGLERCNSARTEQRQVERTLKTCKSPFRSDFHAAIASLSFLEWRNRAIL